MKKKISVLIITMLLCISALLVVNNEIEAAVGEDDGKIGESIGLDLDFMWNVTNNLSNVVRKIYIEGQIRKGRAFGTVGDRWTANYLKGIMENLSLEPVQKIKLGPISSNPFRFYTSRINVSDYLLHIDREDYNTDTGDPNDIPLNESFVVPSGRPLYAGGTLTRTFTFKDEDDIRIRVTHDLWPCGGSLTGYYLNLSCTSANNYDFVIGNATFINSSEELPAEQDNMVFLIDEKDGCDEIMENVTNATAVILIHDNTIGAKSENATNCSFSVVKADSSDNNLSEILDKIKNETVIVDNVICNKTLTFTTNLDCANWPHYNFVCLGRAQDPADKKDPGWGDRMLQTNTLWLYNHRLSYPFNTYKYKGFILYDHYETHYMNYHNPPALDGGWFRLYIGQPGLPVFSVNNSVGEWLEDHAHQSDCTITGYVLQNYQQEKHLGSPWTAGTEAYNVEGEINIEKSPGDARVVISNRYDGWWSEAPFDSGAGAGIALGIAKYFDDYDIKPKYNLTFLFTTGEELLFRGAQHYSDYNKDTNFPYWIGFDQLGIKYEDTTLNLTYKDEETRSICENISIQTQYPQRTGYSICHESGVTEGGEDAVWSTRDLGKPKGGIDSEFPCSTICFVKDLIKTNPYRHRAGMNYQEGDSLNYIDRSDLNVTFELAWNITKYFTVNPDCWFTNVTYQVFDSEKDGDTLNDSIRTNFTLNTILPHDNVMVELLYDIQGGGSNILYLNKNYSVNASGRNESLVFSIPDDAAQGGYSLEIRLYNSTAKINKIVFGDTDYNDSNFSSTYHLYHSFGYTQEGSLCQNITDRITGSVFTANEDGVANNITAFINHTFTDPDPIQCMLYRANDSKLIANTSEDYTLRDNLDPLPSAAWAVFDFPEPKPNLSKDTQYVITCWGDNYSMLYYDNFSDPRGRYDNKTYDGTPPESANFTNESRLYSIYCSYTAENYGPNITSVNASPDPIGFGMDITFSANVTDVDGVDIVKVNIWKPQDDTSQAAASSYTMTITEGSIYGYIFNDTWQNGQYNYTIWASDNKGYSNTSSQYSFNVSAQATVSVCTVKDEFGNNTFVNVTDPPSPQTQIGYELLDDGKVLRIWNQFDSYYFDTDNGVQLTNHYNEYWSHNVLMLGYYNNDVWNLIYRSDNLSGFNQNIETDDDTFVNATLWKDLTYEGYDFRLAIRYHLGLDDNELTVIPYIKNIDDKDIPYVLGFAWEINDIQVDMTTSGDYIEINGTKFDLNDTLDLTFSNMTVPVYCWDNTTNETIVCDYVPIPYFHIREDMPGNISESLYLRWDESLKYKVQVKSRDGEYNAPVTLGIKIGTLDIGQEKYTHVFWHDAADVVYYFDSYDNVIAWSTSPGNMVDSSIYSFASTQTDYDIELCDGNTCSGSDLGTISKVEIRCHGKRSGFGMQTPDIILQPLCDYHVFNPGTSGAWSSWFDITDDPNAPDNWTWNDVDNLNCDVVARVLPSYTLYCSKVEVRVTYTSPNYNPVISDPYPVDGATGIGVQPVLNITVSDPDGDNMNITWLSNSSGSWQAFGINSSVGNGTYHQTMVNASVNGEWWYWNVSVSDGTNTNVSDVFKFYTGFESKIENTGSTNISGYLLMQLHYLADMNWIVATEAVNETTTRTINSGDILALDMIFNGKDHTAYLISHFGAGTYRVYAAFRDPDGDVLVCDDQSLMEDSYQFTVSAG